MENAFGALLREARRTARLSQSDLAAQLSTRLGTIDQPVAATISNWERAVSSPSASDRELILALITSLATSGGLATDHDADALLRAGGYASLSPQENGAIFKVSQGFKERSLPRVSKDRDIKQPELPFVDLPNEELPLDSPYYVEHSEHREAVSSIRGAENSGTTIVIKGAHRFGKSSLLSRVCFAAEALGKQSIKISLPRVPDDEITFCKQFCAALAIQLDLDERLDDFWRQSLPTDMACTGYLERYLLPASGPLLIAIDDADSIIEYPFHQTFFAMLRGWHNNRASAPPKTRAFWRQLDLALVISTNPSTLIGNYTQSPFNVGDVIELGEFTPELIRELNTRRGNPLSLNELEQLRDLVGGHPYLIHWALYNVATGRYPFSALLASATDDQEGPFAEHLRHQLRWLTNRPEYVEAMRLVLHDGRSPNELVRLRLQGSGLVRRDRQTLLPSCRLYADYFAERLR